MSDTRVHRPADLGRQKQAQAWLDDYEARAADVKAQLDAAGVAPKVADIAWWDGQVQVGCYSSSCLVFKGLGLEIAALADGDGDGEPDNEGQALGLEQLGGLSDVDLGPENVDNGSELHADDQQSARSTHMWLSSQVMMKF